MALLALLVLTIASVVLLPFSSTHARAQGAILYAGSPPSSSGFEIAYNTSGLMGDWGVGDWGLLWWNGIYVFVNMPAPMLEGYDTYFAKALYGPLLREYPVNNGTWLLSYVELPYSYPSSLNPLPANETYEYKLGEALLVSLEGDVAIVMISYKDVGSTSIPLNQYWSHIHKGLDGLRINVLPSANLSPTEMLGLLTGNGSLADLQYYANQIGSFQSNVYLYINGTNVGTLGSWSLWQVLYYNSQATPLVMTYSGYYNSVPFRINVYVLSSAMQVVTYGQGLKNASGSYVNVDNSLLSIQHPAVVLSPGQQVTLYYVIAFNTTLSPGQLQELYSEAQSRLLPLVQYPNASSQASSTPQMQGPLTSPAVSNAVAYIQFNNPPPYPGNAYPVHWDVFRVAMNGSSPANGPNLFIGDLTASPAQLFYQYPTPHGAGDGSTALGPYTSLYIIDNDTILGVIKVPGGLSETTYYRLVGNLPVVYVNFTVSNAPNPTVFSWGFDFIASVWVTENPGETAWVQAIGVGNYSFPAQNPVEMYNLSQEWGFNATLSPDQITPGYWVKIYLPSSAGDFGWIEIDQPGVGTYYLALYPLTPILKYFIASASGWGFDKAIQLVFANDTTSASGALLVIYGRNLTQVEQNLQEALSLLGISRSVTPVSSTSTAASFALSGTTLLVLLLIVIVVAAAVVVVVIRSRAHQLPAY